MNVISKLPPLTALRLFEAAGRHESFKLAAKELGVTPSAVSHGVALLERGIDTLLFDRGVRGISLTPSGREFLRFVAEAFSSIADGMQRLPNRRKQRHISVSCAPIFAARWLLPRLRGFTELHPDTAIKIDTSHRHVDFPADGVDLAIRMGRGPWSGMEATLLFNPTLAPVCAPDHFREMTRAGAAFDLRKTTLLHVTSATEDWAAWMENAGAGEVDLNGGLRFDTIQLTIGAAVAGLGTAIGRLPLIDEELETGRLVRARGPSVKGEVGYWLVASEVTRRWAEVAVFKDWLLKQSAAHNHEGAVALKAKPVPEPRRLQIRAR